MKANELIKLLELNPDAELLVSVAERCAGAYQDTFKQGTLQPIGSITMNAGKNEIQLNGRHPAEGVV